MGDAAPDDWRRQGQERYLRGLTFAFMEWVRTQPGWDHDHCEFCNAKFSNAAGTLRAGYATEDLYRWICPTCYADFWREFGWAPPAT
ncbi:MAG: hypothetical protein R3F05_19490 [Planctomycetota bacterium]